MNTEPPFVSLTGRCRCEQARFRLESAPMITHCCHCHLCQQLSGSAFSNFSMIEADRVTLLAGKTRSFQGAKNHKQIQCQDCGCTLWMHRADLGDGVALVAVGMLDDGERLPPEAHFFTRTKRAWVTLPPGVPAFDERGDPGKAGVRERILAVMARKPRA